MVSMIETKDKIKHLFSVIKTLMRDKEFLTAFILFIVSSTICLYLLCINHSVRNLIFQSLAAYMGYRIASYGWFAFLPGGKWLSEHYYCTVKYNFKSWYRYFQFIKENTFTLDYEYISREMVKGDPASKRETTGISAVTFGFGRSKYIFKLE
jgi:hypothetical protein